MHTEHISRGGGQTQAAVTTIDGRQPFQRQLHCLSKHQQTGGQQDIQAPPPLGVQVNITGADTYGAQKVGGQAQTFDNTVAGRSSHYQGMTGIGCHQ